jgi:cysteine desulfurase
MSRRPIYLDYQATTPCDARVLDAMLPYFTEFFGNAASISHPVGMEAQKAVSLSRAAIARAVGAREPGEIIFTSGATEGDNLAVKGAALAGLPHKNHIVTVCTEHKAVLDSCRALERFGIETTYLPVQQDGRIDLQLLAEAVTPRTSLVSVMAVNNEIGVIQDIRAIAGICREHGVLFHTDATQAAGKIPFHVQDLGVDLACFTAHKMYGPKGCGALYARRGIQPLVAHMDGGGHERGLRSGTLNVTGIVGLAAALQISVEELDEETMRFTALRNRLLTNLQRDAGPLEVNGSLSHRLPGNLNVSFDGVSSERLLFALPQLCMSGASACSSASAKPSHVVSALGFSEERAAGAVRMGIGRFTTEAEIDEASEMIAAAAAKIRSRTKS